VVALEALHEAGTPLETAARELLRRHKGIALLGGGKLKHQAGISTLLTWRKQFSSGRVGDFEANELFSAGRELIRKFSGDVAQLHRIADDRARSASAAGGVFAPPPIHRRCKHVCVQSLWRAAHMPRQSAKPVVRHYREVSVEAEALSRALQRELGVSANELAEIAIRSLAANRLRDVREAEPA
jgi:hypothetical protein